MTTEEKRPKHLIWPSPSRLKRGLSTARKENLIPVYTGPSKKKDSMPVHRTLVTPSGSPDPYVVSMIYKIDTAETEYWVNCTCPAGEHGIPCKHVALTLDVVTTIGKYLKDRVRVLTPDELDHIRKNGDES